MGLARIEWLETRRLCSDGDLDVTFGSAANGTTSFHFGTGVDTLRGLVQEPDGSYIVAGLVKRTAPASSRIALAHLLSDGTLDPAFANNGKESLDLGEFVTHSLALEPDGHILIGGTSSLGQPAIVRFNSNGSLDSSFGAGGVASAAINGGSSVMAMLVQPGGQIVAAGGDTIERFNPDGSLDTGFGAGGSTLIGFGPLRTLAFDGSGNILAAGTDAGGGVVARFTPSGAFDPSFFAFTTFAPDQQKGQFNDLFVTRTGQIVAGGFAESADGSKKDMVVCRFNSDGSPDGAFGVHGVVIESLATAGGNDRITGVIEQSDGKVVASGFSKSPDAKAQFDVLRFNNDGSLDTTFAGSGVATTTFDFPVTAGKARAIVIEPEGKVVVAGEAGGHFAIARYQAAFGTYNGTELVINGTASADTITLATDTLKGNITATVDGVSETFLTNDTSRILVYGFAGADSISASPGVVGAELRGAPGADTLVAGDGADTLIGGGGNDSLVGGSGVCSLRGGAGDDTLAAGGGNSFLRGGIGDDLMQSGAGNDIFFAVDLYADTLSGGGGNDTAYIDVGLEQVSGIGTLNPP